MALRVPDEVASPDFTILENQLKASPLKWHDIECQLVTPLYGGGVQSATVDEKMPIRVASIRGQLRFWWRFLAKNKWKLGSDAEIRKAEFALWGGMDDGDAGKASEVFLRVKAVENSLAVGYDTYLSSLSYVFFPSALVKRESKNKIIHKVIPEDCRWTLQLRFQFKFSSKQENKNIEQEQKRQEQVKKQVIETLRWWGQFGGLGFRSRRGAGAVQIQSCQDFPHIVQVLSQEEVEATGCQWVKQIQAHSTSVQAWEKAVKKLSNFRQGENVGRNGKQGRSYWPEPDSIRRIQNRWESKHKPDLCSYNIFPRSLFGLPIRVKFHDKDKEDPFETTINFKDKERLPSPVLIRPVSDGKGKWVASALVLPYEHLKQLSVQLDKKTDTFKIWDEEVAAQIRPIADNGGGDPLQAFLNYFKKSEQK